MFRDKKLGHERIMSIPPNNEADSDEKFHVGVCYRHGVAVYKDTWYVVHGHGGQRGGAAAGGRALDQPSSAIS